MTNEVDLGAVRRGSLRYTAAVLAAATGFGLRVGLEAWVGHGLPTFITFYPMVMLVALLAGFGPGLVATGATMLAVAFWLDAPFGEPGVVPAVERLSLAFFGCMGLFMSAVAALYRRTREKAVAYDREQALRQTYREKELLAQQRQLALDAADMGWWQYNPITRVAEWDAGYKRIFGVSGNTRPNDEILSQIIHPEDLPALWTKVEEALDPSNPRPYAAEYRIRRADDGQERWIEAYGVATFEGEGKDRRAVNFVGTVADITERKRAESILKGAKEELERRVQERTGELEQARRAVEAERQKLYDVLETLPVYVALLSKDYRVPFANRFFRERFGESRGQRCYEFLFHRAEPCENCESYKAMKTGAPHHWEWTGPDGRNYDIHDFPFTEADGSPMILEMGIDVTEVKKAQDELRRQRDSLEATVKERTRELSESEARYRSYLDVTDQLGWTTDPEGLVVEDLPTWRRYTGQSRDEIHGWGWSKALHPDDLGRVTEVWRAAVRAKRNYEIEYRIRRHDGEYRHFLVRGVPVCNEDGSIREWVGTCIDITEREKSEEAARQINAELERRTAALEKANKDLEASRLAALNLMDDAIEARRKAEQVSAELERVSESLILAQQSAGAGTWDWDMTTGRLQWSPELFRLFGLDPASAQATFDVWRAVILPEDREAASARIERAIEQHTRLVNEYRAVLPSGEVRWINALGDTTYGADGKPVRMAGICLDITDRKRAEEALRISNSRLDLLAETTGELLRSENPQADIERLCRKTLAVLDCHVFFNFLVDESVHRLRLNAHAGIPDDEARKIEWLDYGVAVCGCVARDGARIVAEHISGTDDPRTELVKSFGVKAYACHPLLDAQGKIIGTLSFGTRTRETFNEDDLALMKALSDHVATAMVRTRSELALMRSREDLARAQEVGQIGSWRLDVRRNVLTWSEENHRIFGVPKGTPLTYETFLGTIHPDDRAHVDTRWKAALRGEPYDIEHRIVADGQTKWVREKAYLEFDRDGHLLGGFGITQDITGRKQAQLREQEALAAAAAAQTALDTVEAMGEGVLLADMEGRIDSVNPALEKIGGYAESEVKGRNLVEMLTEMVAEEDLGIALEELAQALRGQQPALSHLTIVRKDGKRIPVMPSISFIRTPDGKPATIVVAVRDISELHETYRALGESERKYRELVESANSIILRITPSHDILFLNEYGEGFFGYSESELLGKSVLGTIVPPVDSEGRDMAAMLRAITEDPVAYAHNENENICKDGRRVWVHWTNRAVRDADGRVCEILCVGADATQRRRLEADKERYQQRLRELAIRLASTEERERRRISRQIHDTVIQTLSLCNIRLGSVRKGLSDAAQLDRAEDLNRARSLVEDAIKECRSLMAELTPPLLYELGLAPALQDLAQRLEKQHQTPIQIQDDEQPKPLDKAIQALVFDAARELIINSLKHAGKCTITVSLSRENYSLRVTIKDNGSGFAVPADGRFMFRDGGGFGLFSILERIRQVGGNLHINSHPGKGTSASILVPLTQAGA